MIIRLEQVHIFTSVDQDGNNTNIDVTGLYAWCQANKPEVFLLPMLPGLAGEYIGNKIVDLDRVKELKRRRHLTPIIMCKDGTYGDDGAPNVLLVDGHHRYVLAALMERKHFKAHMLEEEQWRPFQLHGLPTMTQEQLLATPNRKRDY